MSRRTHYRKVQKPSVFNRRNKRTAARLAGKSLPSRRESHKGAR